MTRGEHDVEPADDPRVDRRRFLGAGVAVATAAVAGCSSFLGGGGGDPEGAIREFYTALNEGDVETVNSRIHPDGEADEITQDQADQLSQAEFSVESTEVVEQEDDRAVVNTTVSISMMGQEQSQSADIELRRHDGQWKIWDGE